MKKEERLENINNMEYIFNELNLSLKDMEKSFKNWKRLLPKFKKLMDYYGSEQWKKDYYDVNNGILKPEGFHGILSEDTIYDFYQEQREFCVEIIKFTDKILKF